MPSSNPSAASALHQLPPAVVATAFDGLAHWGAVYDDAMYFLRLCDSGAQKSVWLREEANHPQLTLQASDIPELVSALAEAFVHWWRAASPAERNECRQACTTLFAWAETHDQANPAPEVLFDARDLATGAFKKKLREIWRRNLPPEVRASALRGRQWDEWVQIDRLFRDNRDPHWYGLFVYLASTLTFAGERLRGALAANDAQLATQLTA